MKLDSVNIDDVTPMMKEYIKIKNENPDIILFYRLGDFYEMFFEDAEIASRELELTLTGKSAGLQTRIPMCGVPHHAINVYLQKLIDKGYKVGICEQMEDPKLAKGIVKRELIQIVSKGTILNESLNEKENNYIGAIIDFKHLYCLCYSDITTGNIYTMFVNHKKTDLVNEIAKKSIKEIIVKSSFDKEITSYLKKQYNTTISIYDNILDIKSYEHLFNKIEDIRHIETIKLLISYIIDTQKRSLNHLQEVIVKENNNYLKMNMHTKNNLELTETIRHKDRTYSLIWLLDKTKTAMGSRLLKRYIEEPLTDIKKINDRYDTVEILSNEFMMASELGEHLYNVYDIERLVGKIAFGSANARDLIQLKNSLKFLPDINEILKQLSYKNIETFNKLFDLLEVSIYEDAPISIKEGYLIKTGFDKELDELKEIRKGGKNFIATFEKEERIRTGIKTLKVGYNRVFGYYIEISKGQVKDVKEEYGYERRQTLSNCERYISKILKEKEDLILNAEEKIVNLEYDLFIKVKDEIKKYIPKLQETANILAEIDVLLSFSIVSNENKYVRPTIKKERNIYLVDSRHPVVEKVNNIFTPNDIMLDEDTYINIITGPNMAGKSTYIRQLAITVIMAQIGCFVPAKEAILPVFDAIYTRIGAADDLVSGESTFMVEMIEANEALTNATENSLILFDELGRGTSTFDGMAIAQSIIEYIHNEIKCKTLFSTHYHELTDLDNSLNHLKNIHVSTIEENGNITFLHKIKKGSASKSYGIHVASLAGMPKELLKRADSILKVYEETEQKRERVVQAELPLVVEIASAIEEEIKELDILNVTPLEALNILYKLKEKIK